MSSIEDIDLNLDFAEGDRWYIIQGGSYFIESGSDITIIYSFAHARYPDTYTCDISPVHREGVPRDQIHGPQIFNVAFTNWDGSKSEVQVPLWYATKATLPLSAMRFIHE